MTRLQQIQHKRPLLLLCMLLSPAGVLMNVGPKAAVATEQPIIAPITADAFNKAVDAFVSRLGGAYDMSGRFGVDAELLKQIGVPEQYIRAADNMRQQFRQRLVNATSSNLLANLTAASNISSITDSLLKSSTPMVLAQDGTPMLPQLQAFALFLGQKVQDLVKQAGATGVAEALSGLATGKLVESLTGSAGGNIAEALSGAATGNIADVLSQLGTGSLAESLGGAALADIAETISKAAKGKVAESLASLLPNLAGRKLMAVETDDAQEELDPVAAAERDIERVQRYLFNLAEMADEVFTAEKAWDEAHGVAEDAKTQETLQASHRRLQQAGNPFDNYATAFRFIFSTLFDFFRADGLYGLIPIIADVRGIFNRYNWISDLLQLASAPVENFVNANYFPLPQSNDDAISLGKKLLTDFCKFEEVKQSKHTLAAYTGPEFSIELKPVSCPIYKDKLYGRSYISFADCEPAQLVIKMAPLRITGPYHTAATYTGNSCKYTEVYGIDTSFSLGGGEAAFNFTRSAQGIDIVPTVVQLAPDFQFFGYKNGPILSTAAATGGGVGATGGPGVQVTTSATVTNPPRVVNTAGPTVQPVNLTRGA